MNLGAKVVSRWRKVDQNANRIMWEATCLDDKTPLRVPEQSVTFSPSLEVGSAAAEFIFTHGLPLLGSSGYGKAKARR